MTLGIVCGSYLFGRKQEKKHPNLLNNVLKKLSLYVAFINNFIMCVFILFIVLMNIIPINGIFLGILTIGLNILIFISYYFGTLIWVKLGIKKERSLIEVQH